jgi:hypothetical protein
MTDEGKAKVLRTPQGFLTILPIVFHHPQLPTKSNLRDASSGASSGLVSLSATSPLSKD